MKTSELISVGSAAALALSALVLTGMNVQFAYKRAHPPVAQPYYKVVEWRRYETGGQRIGGASARLTIVVFSDYECPACRRMNARLNALLRKHPDVAVVVRHYPIEGHAFAFDAAAAAECAADRQLFAEYHSALFSVASIDAGTFTREARRLGISDTVSFRRCMHSGAIRDRINQGLADGKRIGLFATPTLLVESNEYVGSVTGLEQIVKERLRQRYEIPKM